MVCGISFVSVGSCFALCCIYTGCHFPALPNVQFTGLKHRSSAFVRPMQDPPAGGEISGASEAKPAIPEWFSLRNQPPETANLTPAASRNKHSGLGPLPCCPLTFSSSPASELRSCPTFPDPHPAFAERHHPFSQHSLSHFLAQGERHPPVQYPRWPVLPERF